MNLLQNFHLVVTGYLYRGRRAVPLQTLVKAYGFVNHFTQCALETTEFGKITQNKGHFAIQGHSRSPILVPIEST